MTIPELVLAIRYWFEKLEASERTGDEAQVQARLVELRELLNNQPELEAGGSLRTEKTDEASEG